MSKRHTGTTFGYRVLSAVTRWRLRKTVPTAGSKLITGTAGVDAAVKRLNDVFGSEVQQFHGKTIVDYGCSDGLYVAAAGRFGASRCIGIDIREDALKRARILTSTERSTTQFEFYNASTQREHIDAIAENVDVVFSIDSFEHFVDPQKELEQIYRLLAPGGQLLVWFGPPWWHPYGMHLRFLRPLPWTHLVFSEQTIIRVRNDYRPGGEQSFADIALGRMTIRKFIGHIEHSGFQVKSIECVPIRHCRILARLPGMREFLTSVVRCTLSKPADPPAARPDDAIACNERGRNPKEQCVQREWSVGVME